MFDRLRRFLGLSSKPRRKVKASYDAARTTKENEKHWANADSMSANAAHDPTTRQRLRDRARYECANNGYAGGLVESLAADTVGTGPRLQLTIPDADRETIRGIETAWVNWCKATDLADDLRVMHGTQIRDGEAFGLLVDNPAILDDGRTPISLDLRVYESEQITDPYAYSFDPLYVDGIRFDAVGNVQSYTFLNHHPGGPANYLAYETRVIGAASVLHWYKPFRPGQARGVSHLAPSLPLYAQLRRYTLATLGAAELAAMLAGVMKTNLTPDANGPVLAEAMDEIELVRNALLTLPAGWDATQFKPEQPVSTYKDFKGEILNEIGRGTQTPFNVIAGNSSGYNYSSGRLDHLLYHRTIAVDRSRLQLRVLDRLFLAWLREATLVGIIPQNLAPVWAWTWSWHWDGFESIDPQKDAATDEIELRNGTTTYAAIYARKGLDWEEQFRQRAREMALMSELGLTPATTAPVAIPEPQAEDANAEAA